MQPDFATRFPFKVFYRIGDVNRRPIDTGRLETLIEQLTGGPHKWFSQLIFAIARLFTYKKDRGVCLSLAKYYLRRVLVEIASTTILARLSQAGEVMTRRQELRGGPGARVKEVHSSCMMQYLAAKTNQGRTMVGP
jgi:hypothetical protein